MKNSNVVSSSVLLFNSLLLLVLGARVWSAPDVFADGLGRMPLEQATINELAAIHGGSFIAFGAAGLAVVFAPVLLRWFSLLLLTVLGAAVYIWLWSFPAQSGYTTLLCGVLAINLVTLATAFFGEPLLAAGQTNTNTGETRVRLRWG